MSFPDEGPPPDLPLSMLPPRPRRERWWLHVLLLVLTFGAMTWTGMAYVGALDPAAFRDPERLPLARLLLESAFWYALPLALILFSHEMGHYLMCRRYGVDASPPYFVPMPLLSPFGTMGAFIRIREPMRWKRQVFDIGVAGPIAGFVVCLPFLVYGILHTHPHAETPLQPGTWLFAYPPLVTLLQQGLLGHTFDTRHVFEHPTFMAAWAGLFVTMFNLIPLGQLDGGHALYAVLGRFQRWAMVPLLAGLAFMGYAFRSWWVLAGLVLVFGLRHPRVLDEDHPLGAKRLAVAFATLAVFLLCFMPVPIVETESAPRRAPRERRGTFVHQLDGHRGSEDARLHAQPVRAQRGDVAVEERAGGVGKRGAAEARPPAS